MRTVQHRPVAVLGVTAALVLLATSVAPSASATTTTGPSAAVTLKVMSQNIFYGGDDLVPSTETFCPVADGCPENLLRIERVIRMSGADVVGLQEAERNTDVIAKALGWYSSARDHVISRFPIVDPPDGDGVYVFVEPSPGRVVAVANVHMPSDPYGPYAVRDGATRAQVLELERTVRLPAIQTQLKVLPELAAQGIPVFLTGDFNSPSYLDWTAAVAKVRPDVKYPVVWPVSKALADAGLKDSYREAHPDPVAVPGFTWTPGSPEADLHEVFDRIDWVLHAGPVTTLASTVVGEVGDVDAGVQVSPYPSDHRGVVSTFRVRPAVSPVLVAPMTRRLSTGQSLGVTFHALGQSGERVGVVLAGTGPASMVFSLDTHGRTDGTLFFGGALTATLAPAAYDVLLISPQSQVLSRSPFWLYPPGTHASITTDSSTYTVGQPIGVSWDHAPGMALDWVGVFRCYPAGCAGNGGYLLYWYTHTAIRGSGVIGPGADTFPGAISWPLPPGTYVVRLLTDDGYKSIAVSARFTVTG
ncbi:MAG: endonuclease/exonuclease/phosphatase family protein [Actinomycetes bacterium]